MTEPSDDELVPVSVRLGAVVPPEDPEDWTRPLTWMVAAGMLAGPLAALAWFVVAAPRSSDAPLPGTWLVGIAVAGGAAAVGATQIGRLRSFTGTLGAGLFAAVATVLIGLVMAGERQVEAASPSLAHGLAAAIAGTVGALAASLVAPGVAAMPSRLRRLVVPGLAGAVAAVATLSALFGG